MPKTLTTSEIEELRELLEAIDYRLVTTDGQTLAEATQGEVLDDKNSFTLELGKELSHIKRIRGLLGLDVPLREQLAREGKIPPYRDKSVIKAKAAAKRRT